MGETQVLAEEEVYSVCQPRLLQHTQDMIWQSWLHPGTYPSTTSAAPVWYTIAALRSGLQTDLSGPPPELASAIAWVPQLVFDFHTLGEYIINHGKDRPL